MRVCGFLHQADGAERYPFPTRGESLVAERLDGIQACGPEGRNEAADESHEDQHQGRKGYGAEGNVEVNTTFA